MINIPVQVGTIVERTDQGPNFLPDRVKTGDQFTVTDVDRGSFTVESVVGEGAVGFGLNMRYLLNGQFKVVKQSVES